jgi:hypothetical protein
MRGLLVDLSPSNSTWNYVTRNCALLMKTKVTSRLEAERRSERKAYRRARKRALARLREGTDLQWTPPRYRDETHQR